MDYQNMNKSSQERWLNILPSGLRFFYPIRMLLRLYATLVLIWDVYWLILYSIFFILKSVFSLIKAPPLKPVDVDIVLVVGAGRGVGKEVAKQMSMLGAIVVCVDINKASNEATALEAQDLYPYKVKKVWHYTCDVTNQAEVLKLSINIKNDIGDVTMLFHCCGIPSPRSLLAEPSDDIYKTMDLTLTSQFWLLEAFLPMMKKKNHGHIVALTSVAGLSSQKGQLPHSVAQFAVQGLAESVLDELRISKNHNVHVTIVHIYPFILSEDSASDIRLRLPSYFGTIKANYAARYIIDAVRRNYVEASIPKNFIFIGHLLRILPREATVMIRDMLDTGVDFA